MLIWVGEVSLFCMVRERQTIPLFERGSKTVSFEEAWGDNMS